MERGQCLLQAHTIINKDRQDKYGAPEDSFGVMAALLNVYFADSNYTFSARDAIMIMSLLKLSRIINGKYNEDNFVDACGYLGLANDEIKRMQNIVKGHCDEKRTDCTDSES